jgi:hypothetical protein
MATFNKFNAFVEALAQKKINLNTDVLKIMLTNTAPVATNSVKTDLTDIAAGNGYTAGGTAIGSNAATQVSGVLKLVGNAVTFTASGGAIATFRYAAVYSDTATNKDLIGWADYGAAVNVAALETFVVGNPVTGGNWDTTNFLISIT